MGGARVAFRGSNDMKITAKRGKPATIKIGRRCRRLTIIRRPNPLPRSDFRDMITAKKKDGDREVKEAPRNSS
jgi:hypothetical protein